MRIFHVVVFILFCNSSGKLNNAGAGFIQLEEISPISVSAGHWGYISIDKDYDDNPIALINADGSETIYEHSIEANGPAEIYYDISEMEVDRLTFFYGVLNGQAGGSVYIKVYIDGTEVLGDNKLYTYDVAKSFANISIPAGAKLLKLVVEVSGDDIYHNRAIFAEPMLHATDVNKVQIGAYKSLLVVSDVVDIYLNDLYGLAIDRRSANTSYVSSNTTVATVSAQGLITAVAVGTTTIAVSVQYKDSVYRSELAIAVVTAQRTWRVAAPASASTASSPTVTVRFLDGGSVEYDVVAAGAHAVTSSPLGITTSLGDFTTGLVLAGEDDLLINETYTLPSGKTSTYVNLATQKTLHFTKADMLFDVVLRVYADGFGFRYDIAAADGRAAAVPITFATGGAEKTTVAVPSDAAAMYLPSVAIGDNFEGVFRTGLVTTLNGPVTVPFLYRTAAPALPAGELWVLVSEAHLDGSYCGSVVQTSVNTNRLVFAFPPMQDSDVVATVPFSSPWRYAVIGTTATIVENTLAENLSPAPADPQAYGDFAWVQPGVTAWTWKQGGRVAQHNETMIMEYVDMAAEMGWTYFLLDEGWQPPAPEGEGLYKGVYEYFPALVKYAASKGVRFLAWVHANDFDTPEKRTERLDEFQQLGIAGIKADFFDRESQDRIQLYNEIYEKAAARSMIINCHGANKPTGERRKWPNVINREGVRGDEQSANFAYQDAILPFTRSAVGPTDFTPHLIPPGVSNTTTAHQLALNVVLESGIPCMADSLANYEGSVARDFLTDLPAAWDETRQLDGTPGTYCVTARRKGEVWYVGGINSGTARNFTVALGFIGDVEGSYQADIYKDGDFANRAEVVVEVQLRKRSVDTIEVEVAPTGGFGIKLTRIS